MITRRRFPVNRRDQRLTTWLIRTDAGIEYFSTSLASLLLQTTLDPIPADAWVILERNNQLIYRGPWRGELPTAPTLL